MEAAESLFRCLEQVEDTRKAREVRHPFQAILRLTLLGLVCGQTTMAHIALFARMHWPTLKDPLGFLRDHPPHATSASPRERRGRFFLKGLRTAPEASMKTAGLVMASRRFPVASAKLMPASASLSLAEGPRNGATTMGMTLLSGPQSSRLWGSS